MNTPWRRFLIAPGLLEATEAQLSSFNTRQRKNEGFVYWAGRAAGKDCIALALYRPAARVTPGSVDISPEENTRFIRWLRENELTHVGQVHTHPPGIDVHSDGDDHWAFMKFRGLISIVVPNYGVNGMKPLSKCGIHYFDGEQFVRLKGADLRNAMVILPAGGP